jgi:hypothetical protein
MTFLFRKNNREGFAMLFAVLTASLLLTIGMAIFSLSFKELAISTAARESQIAFYAADSARECALYWDVKKGAFGVCLNMGCSSRTIGISNIVCNGKSLSVPNSTTPNSTSMTYNFNDSVSPDASFQYIIDANQNQLSPSSNFSVLKNYDGTNIVTTITALGHNVGSAGRRVERGISQTY